MINHDQQGVHHVIVGETHISTTLYTQGSRETKGFIQKGKACKLTQLWWWQPPKLTGFKRPGQAVRTDTYTWVPASVTYAMHAAGAAAAVNVCMRYTKHTHEMRG